MATIREVELMERIVRAKSTLQEVRGSHGKNCPAKERSGSIKRCNCGVARLDPAIGKALRELSLD